MSDRTAETPIVVEHREQLWWLLAEAAQLEHGIMCQYLYAGLSLKASTDEGVTEHPAAPEVTAAASSARQLAEALRAHVPAGR